MGSHASPAAAVPGRRNTTSARGEACAGSLQGVPMGLTRTAINRPLATVMIFLALILLGQQAYTKLKVDRFPAITFPVTFADGTDVDQATLDVQRRLAAIGRLLPIDATQPSVQKADPAAIPVLYIV